MMRFSGKVDAIQSGDDDRIDFQGNAFPGDHPENKQGTRVPIPGAFFKG
jgi:hypothetical protein